MTDPPLNSSRATGETKTESRGVIGNRGTGKTPQRNTLAPFKSVVIFAKDGFSDIWADRFVKRHPQGRGAIHMPDNPITAKVLAVISNAAAMAGSGGTIIFLVGHGVADTDPRAKDPTRGNVDLAAPRRSLALGGYMEENVFIDVFYDTNMRPGVDRYSPMEGDAVISRTRSAAQRLANWNSYLLMGRRIREAGVRKVLFLTCRVGNSREFLKKIANDWGVIIEAPMSQIQLTPKNNGNVRIHFRSDAAGHGTNIPESEHELPVFTDADSYRAGPHRPMQPATSP